MTIPARTPLLVLGALGLALLAWQLGPGRSRPTEALEGPGSTAEADPAVAELDAARSGGAVGAVVEGRDLEVTAGNKGLPRRQAPELGVTAARGGISTKTKAPWAAARPPPPPARAAPPLCRCGPSGRRRRPWPCWRTSPEPQEFSLFCD